MNSTAGAYVVLHHTGHGPDHFDLMLAIDADGPLLTWRCPIWPIIDANACEPLPPHRRIYLTYEGAVSGGRGRVRRVADGTFGVISDEIGTIAIVINQQSFPLRK